MWSTEDNFVTYETILLYHKICKLRNFLDDHLAIYLILYMYEIIDVEICRIWDSSISSLGIHDDMSIDLSYLSVYQFFWSNIAMSRHISTDQTYAHHTTNHKNDSTIVSCSILNARGQKCRECDTQKIKCTDRQLCSQSDQSYHNPSRYTYHCMILIKLTHKTHCWLTILTRQI